MGVVFTLKKLRKFATTKEKLKIYHNKTFLLDP